MMNNQYNTTNLTTQHSIQMAQHVATSPTQSSGAILNTFLNAQPQQQQQQLATAVATGAIYTDPRQLQLNSNTIDKNYFATAAAPLGTLGTPQRYYTTAGSTATGSANAHPSTILITNNFAHQQTAQPLSPEQHRNIRIVTSSANPLNSLNAGNLASTASGLQHSQHVFNINNKPLQHLFPQHLLQQNFQPAATTELLQHFTTQNFPASQPNHPASSTIQMPQYYVSSGNSISQLNTNPKILTNIGSSSVTSADGNNTASLMGSGSNTNSNSSTVVLDRINICINNLYTDTSSSSSASNSLASTPAQQPSPIIPAIQHKPIMESGPTLPMAAEVYESNVLVIDEPDSTTTATTPHTPPTTPDNTSISMPNITNNNNNIISTTSSLSSPSTSLNHLQFEKSKSSFASVSQSIEKATQDSTIVLKNYIPNSNSTTDTTTSVTLASYQEQRTHITHNIISNSPLTPPTPPSPGIANDNNKDYQSENKQTATVPLAPLFLSGEDVFIKRHDGRFYLGTVIDTARNQFLVRFDDKTEVWCDAEKMRKLGGSNNKNSTEENTIDQPMCVACKRFQPDSKVEICERCGRGYHRKCTSETLPDSGIWLCKRCGKPMKLDGFSTEEETEVETCLKLHYNIESLTWDDKHRMNVEQIYCYCGKSGKFDNNMLQCWRCLNWYHTHCIYKFNGNILRGDSFFVFCCSICNEGEEYLRRLQSNWVELVHLILYNLSVIKKHHKYHHLLKDINPFILEKRKMCPIPKEWIYMPEKQFLDKIKLTLIGNTHIFMCGKEIKRDHNLYTLRSIEPPLVMKMNIKVQDILNDDFIFNILKLQVLPEAPENVDFKFLNSSFKNLDNTPVSKPKMNEDSSSHDVYEFDDTSEDEVPIKRILDKVKKPKLSALTEVTVAHADKTKMTPNKNITSTTTLEKMDVEDDNANDVLISQLSELQSEKSSSLSPPRIEKKLISKKEGTTTSPLKCSSDSSKCKEEPLNSKHTEKSSRKRKAFTLSKSYNDPRLFDSSSDENSSSSSRGTSLDLIIPPPKNFLGQNNPFRIISPKKSSIDVSNTSGGKKSVSFGIFNTTALNFSSKLAALKSAGLFPKLSTTNLAKAAGQPRTVRTIKRRLSAKDITIGPNKEVRRRRTRRLSSNIEVISTTTINPIPTNYFPIQAKDLLAAAAATTATAASLFNTTQNKTSSISLSSLSNINNSVSSYPITESSNIENSVAPSVATSLPTHGRCLRQRPQKNSPNTSRRSSVSSNQSSTSSASAGAAGTTSNASQQSHDDLKQTVNKYFGIVNRIESGEQFSIRAKRQLPNGQMQYLIEWGETQMPQPVTTQNHTNPVTTNPIDITTANSELDEISIT